MISIMEFDPAKHQQLLEQCCDLHISIVEHDGAMLRFMPPFPADKRARMLSWWQALGHDVKLGRRHILLAMSSSPDPGAGSDVSPTVAGTVILEKPDTETGPMRGGVEMLLVSPLHRRKGLGKQLMAELEQIARREGRTLLSLSTTVGSDAEFVYPRLGYTELGRIPDYGRNPAQGGALADGVYYYKDLRKAEPL